MGLVILISCFSFRFFQYVLKYDKKGGRVMNIRKALLDDLNKGLLEVYIEGYEFHRKGRPDIFSSKTDLELKDDLLKNLEEKECFVLENNGGIVGFILYCIVEKQSRILWIDQLVITSSYRRQGGGKKLLNKVVSIAKENNCTRLQLSCWSFNENAIQMYSHIGFKEQRVIMDMDIS